jgi:very-short-patch-repair endonuclease
MFMPMRGSGETEYLAKQLRRVMSPPERRVWFRLRGRQPGQPSFRRQHAVGPYVADFYCAKARLVVEIDGLVHGRSDETAAHDARRDAYMRHVGLRVLRIPASEVFANCDDIVRRLKVLALRMSEARNLRRDRCGIGPPPPLRGPPPP